VYLSDPPAHGSPELAPMVYDEPLCFGAAAILELPVHKLDQVAHGVPGVVVVVLGLGDESGAVQEEVARGQGLLPCECVEVASAVVCVVT
jgi:hypothetical protein